MIVKRISYFSFIVAITTIATVGACQKTNAQYKCFANNDIDLVSYVANIIEYSLDWQNSDLQNGIKSGTVKIIANKDDNNNISICLEVAKSYKGAVNTLFQPADTHSKSASIFQVKCCSKALSKAALFSPSTTTDKRANIADKNLILLI